MVQVVAVERAAVEFLVDRLDAGNVLSAMALGEHLSAGEIGRDLQEKSKAWLNKNFGLIVAEPSFLQLPAAEVVGLVESDDIEGPEAAVFGAVMAWVKGDEAVRKVELDRLLSLVRFPMMENSALAMMAEPLVAQHALLGQLMFDSPAVRPVGASGDLPAASAADGAAARRRGASTPGVHPGRCRKVRHIGRGRRAAEGGAHVQ